MKAEILNSIQEWLKPIRQQMEANNKAVLTQAMSGGSGTGLMSKLLKTSANIESYDPYAMQRDLQLRSLFTRIKYANISRGQRDSLSSMVRNLAAEDRLGTKTIGKIYQMVGLIESFGSTGRERKASSPSETRKKPSTRKWTPFSPSGICAKPRKTA